MREIVSDPNLVAYCGLYCGACRKYLSDRCPGCHDNQKASWCKVRLCCRENNYTSCADCETYQNPKECKQYNNFIASIFGFIFRSDRAACIEFIKKKGIQDYAEEMTSQRRMSIPR